MAVLVPRRVCSFARRTLTITTITTTTTLHIEIWEMTAEVSQIVETSFETNQRQNRLTRQIRLARGGFSVLCPRYATVPISLAKHS